MIKGDKLRVIHFQAAHTTMPVMAIVRGEYMRVLSAAVPIFQTVGLRALEITFNSPNPFRPGQVSRPRAHLPQRSVWNLQSCVEAGVRYGAVNVALKLTYNGDVAWATREDLEKHLDGAALETWR